MICAATLAVSLLESRRDHLLAARGVSDEPALDVLREAVRATKAARSAAFWNHLPLSKEVGDAIAAHRAARAALATALELDGEPRPGTTLIVWHDEDPSLVLTENVEEYLTARGRCWDWSSQDQNAIIDDEGCVIAELEEY